MTTPPPPRERLLARIAEIEQELEEIAELRPRLEVNAEGYAAHLRREQEELRQWLERNGIGGR